MPSPATEAPSSAQASGSMRRDEALRLLGGPGRAAREIGCTVQAIHGWPDPLSERIRDRVQAALWRRLHGVAPPLSAPAAQDHADAPA